MATQELVTGKTGVTVKSEMLRDDVPSSFLLKINGKRVWVSKLVCTYDKVKNEATIAEWYYDKLVGENKI